MNAHFEKEFLEKSGLRSEDYEKIIDEWDDAFCRVMERMFNKFPEKMSNEIIDILLERERKIEKED